MFHVEHPLQQNRAVSPPREFGPVLFAPHPLLPEAVGMRTVYSI